MTARWDCFPRRRREPLTVQFQAEPGDQATVFLAEQPIRLFAGVIKRQRLHLLSHAHHSSSSSASSSSTGIPSKCAPIRRSPRAECRPSTHRSPRRGGCPGAPRGCRRRWSPSSPTASSQCTSIDRFAASPWRAGRSSRTRAAPCRSSPRSFRASLGFLGSCSVRLPVRFNSQSLSSC